MSGVPAWNQTVETQHPEAAKEEEEKDEATPPLARALVRGPASPIAPAGGTRNDSAVGVGTRRAQAKQAISSCGWI